MASEGSGDSGQLRPAVVCLGRGADVRDESRRRLPLAVERADRFADLGPVGRGDVVFLTAIAWLVSHLSTFGIQEANANLAGAQPRLRPALATNSILFASFFGILAAGALTLMIAVFPAVGGESTAGPPNAYFRVPPVSDSCGLPTLSRPGGLRVPCDERRLADHAGGERVGERLARGPRLAERRHRTHDLDRGPGPRHCASGLVRLAPSRPDSVAPTWVWPGGWLGSG